MSILHHDTTTGNHDSWAPVELTLIRDPFGDDGPIPDPFADDDNPGLAALEAPAPDARTTFASLPAWVEAQASHYDSKGTEGGDLAAWALRRLAGELSYHGAGSVAELEARIELAEDARDAHLVATGRDVATEHERYSVGWARFIRDECGDPSELDRELAGHVLRHNP